MPGVLAALFLLLAAPAAVSAERRAADDDAARQLGAGQRLAEAVTVTTGVPISPLLGVSGLGAYRWLQTPESLRPALPWYCRPAFWGSGLFLVFLFAANTAIGALLPGLKKPMDFVEQYENQASALLASPIVLIEARRLVHALPNLSGALEIGSGALVLFAFAVVFLAFHAVQVAIALSPSATLDLLLRLFRAGMLATAGISAWLHPYLGAAFGVVLVVLCWIVAGWSFRLTVFGSVFTYDLLWRRPRSPEASGAEPLVAFSGRGIAGPPLRSYGRFERDESGRRLFRWRPWLVMPARKVEIAAAVRLAVRRGTLSPSLFIVGGVREPTAARFPPRFRGREAELLARLGAEEVRDGRLVRGLRAAWQWLRDLLHGADGATEPAAR